MRLLRTFAVFALASCAWSQEDGAPPVTKEKHEYRSDVARLRGIVINSLYSHRDIFLRELVSNANDALEKLRLTALTDKSVWDGADPLNITIKAVKDEDGSSGRIIISDTGIGMTREELTTNLGTLAKSGTSDFLSKAEGQDTTGQGNLIGAFGLGFYSSFLVADNVQVVSIAPESATNPNPKQYVFSSSADDSSFDVFPDPRGNTLGRGTEITLELKKDALEYLDEHTLSELVNKHSSFSSAFPIYLFTQRIEEVPDEDDADISQAEETLSDTYESNDEEEVDEDEAVVEDTSDSSPKKEEVDEDEAVVEDTSEQADEDEAVVEDASDSSPEEEAPPQKMKSVNVEEWVQLNPLPPIWMRDPKNVSDEDYTMFYHTTFRDFTKPLAWHHFSGDSGSGISFRAIIYLPSRLDDSFWQQATVTSTKDIRLLVKKVFITSDLGEEGLPKWASMVKVIVDAEDLPLNVSRETLQSTKFLRQIKQIIVKRLIQLFTRLSEDPDKFAELQNVYGSVLKLGAVEDQKNRDKLASLIRYGTNQRNTTSLDEYLENKKQGQKQIFYLADIGKSREHLAQSVFVEKLDARGYEVLLLGEPLDEILFQNLKKWKGVSFQDVAKAGLKFGDEDKELEDEKEQQKVQKEKFQPLLDWLKNEAQDIVKEVVISNRLVTSPCAIVADAHGYTANVEKLMSASNNKKKGATDFVHEFAKKQKFLEINPRSPLIEGLLHRVESLPTEEGETDAQAEEELREVASILIDGALVRSGFDVPDSHRFFSRVDRVLRRSLGVSETAPTDSTVKPAPPVDPELPTESEEQEEGFPGINIPESMKDKISLEMEEIDEDGNPVHDEL